MKTLYHALLDYEMALLQAIAACRAIPLNTLSQAEAVRQLTEAMLSPATVAITLADLTEPELAALRFMVQQGGQTDLAPFSRQFGIVRSMGAARLNREKPWQSPVSPMESLWYKGLIYKTFRVTQQGGLEIIFIPRDILPLLQVYLDMEGTPLEHVAPKTVTHLNPSPPPTVEYHTPGRLREQIFSLLSYCQNNAIRAEELTQNKKGLATCLLPPLPVTSMPLEVDFLYHCLQGLHLVETQKRQLRPQRETTRQWLEADIVTQSRMVADYWRTDTNRNDLWHVPGLRPQPTGWENDILLGRSRILAHLAELPQGDWFAINEFIQHIKEVEPDFQRPHGNYDSWYIQNEQGLFLMGFANWDKVEGQFIRYLLTHVLPWLSVVDVGGTAPHEPPTMFRLTPLGQQFLSQAPPPPPPDTPPPPLRLGTDFQVQVPLTASLYDRFQVTRFAQFNRRETDQTRYYITPTSLNQGLAQGITVPQIIAFLQRATAQPVPRLLIDTFHEWTTRRGKARLEQVFLLRLQDEQLLRELRQYVGLESLLGEVINGTTVVISLEDAPQVRQVLTELGYL